MGGALVLLSGGMDSAVCLYKAVADHGTSRVKTVFFDWSQRALARELRAARALCAAAGVDGPHIIEVRFPYGGGLTEPGSPLSRGRSSEKTGAGGTADTFFPGRNIVFLSYAFGMAAVSGNTEVYLGAGADDAAGYPDCRGDFLASMELAGRLGLDRARLSLVLPLIDLDKEGIVGLGDRLGVPWDLTFSCYAPKNDEHCGVCDSCVLRRSALGGRSDRM
ncbi:MAG: 7-cyano-7-deazaguanine synthase [Actinobacteria bacterium]|nr:7-cyano-7-deazaguanine synthase [Actinomycetota bacterium]MBU1942876.1 7-cyano-7-deazaguanine synthase [Actinomycetota bacterium]MBU2687608.1 7-cyano-7-deazaguanine synthase [Actinomycetota bacterium]